MRTSKGELYLIDFDLISIGPEMADYLQYANRILPFLNGHYLNWTHSNHRTIIKIESFFVWTAVP